MAAFLDKVQSSTGDLICLVKGKQSGRKVWYYVLVDKIKLPLFRKVLKQGDIVVGEYGKVLHSGWGEDPPPDIAEAVKKQYS